MKPVEKGGGEMLYQRARKVVYNKYWLLCFFWTVCLWTGVEEAATGGLIFDERVQYQRVIEEVNWRHTIWPEENETAKPSLEEVLPEDTLRNRVEDTLRMSKALEEVWHQPIRGEELQAEMERMAQTSRLPERLGELWGEFGNDPYLIAECLARPVLVERLIREWYSYDERFHGELKKRVEQEVRDHGVIGDMKGMMSGEYFEVELRREEPSEGKSRERLKDDVIELSEEDWNTETKRLAGVFGAKGKNKKELPVGIVSAVQEDEEKFYIMGVLEQGADWVKLATVGWRKVGFEEWWDSEKWRFNPYVEEEWFAYSLPKISAPLSVSNTWNTTPLAFPAPRFYHTAVWTGSVMIVWGGYGGGHLNTGGRYNPSTNSWQSTSTTNAPAPRYVHTAVWRGSVMIVWGGVGSRGYLNTGGRYNPYTNSWQSTSTTNAPAPRYHHTAVWTGSVMIVWGGGDGGGISLNTGGRYNPFTDSWQSTSTTNAPAPRSNHTAVWTGSVMIVWGGGDGGGISLNTGGRYHP